MKTYYTIQLNKKTENIIIFKQSLTNSENQFNNKTENHYVLNAYDSLKQAKAVKEFVEFYIRNQKETIFNWKLNEDSLAFFCEMLDYCIINYNK